MSIGSTDVDFKEIYDAINGAGAHPGTSGTPIGMDSFYDMSFSDGTSTPASGTIGIGGYPEGTNNMRGKTIALDTFTSHTFTNCGATGRLGPTLTQCKAVYPAWASDTSSFNMTSQGIQEWTVPSSGRYEIQAWGPDSRNRGGGYGAIIGGVFELQKGSVIKILVGQRPSPYDGNNGSGAGGTFVVKSPYNTNASILVIAGGAGGAHNYGEKLAADGQSGTSGGTGTNGFAGGTNGGAGATAHGASGSGFFGNGASSMNVDRGGKSFTNGGSGGYYGSYQAGFGGGGAHGTSHGGGAGGYSGGGGSTHDPYVGGGGGSYNSGSNKTTSVGTWVGQGKVTITKLGPLTLPLGVDVTSAGGSSWNGRPFNTYYHDTRYQAIYPAAELTAAGMVSGDSISSIKFKISQQPGIDITKIKIGYAWVSETTFSSWLTPAYSTSISTYSKVSTSVDEWTYKFTFDTTGTWDGSKHLLIEYQHDGTAYLSGGAVHHKKAANGTIASTWKYNDSTNPNMTSLTFDSSKSADDAPYIEIYF
jgi:hypothetical protein